MIVQIMVSALIKYAFAKNSELGLIVQYQKHFNHVLTTMIARIMENAYQMELVLVIQNGQVRFAHLLNR